MTALSSVKPAAAPRTPPLPQAKPESLGLSPVRLQRMSDALRRDIDKGKSLAHVDFPDLSFLESRFLDQRAD